MTEEIKKVFKFASLSRYSFKERVIIRVVDIGLNLFVRMIGKTIRYEVTGWENFESISNSGKVPIYSFWHDRIFAGTYFFRKRRIVVLSSQSFDGEYISRFIQRLGYGSVRGSSTRGGVGALVEMIRLMRQGLPIALTLDGPKGPKYEVKSGVLLLAKKTGHPIMPFIVECKKFWTINSWDRLQIPKPFTKAVVMIGTPIYVDAAANAAEIEAKHLLLQKTLDELVETGKEWSKRS